MKTQVPGPCSQGVWSVGLGWDPEGLHVRQASRRRWPAGPRPTLSSPALGMCCPPCSTSAAGSRGRSSPCLSVTEPCAERQAASSAGPRGGPASAPPTSSRGDAEAAGASALTTSDHRGPDSTRRATPRRAGAPGTPLSDCGVGSGPPRTPRPERPRARTVQTPQGARVRGGHARGGDVPCTRSLRPHGPLVYHPELARTLLIRTATLWGPASRPHWSPPALTPPTTPGHVESSHGSRGQRQRAVSVLTDPPGPRRPRPAARGHCAYTDGNQTRRRPAAAAPLGLACLSPPPT